MDHLLTTEETRARLIELGINIISSTREKWYLNNSNFSGFDLCGTDFEGVNLKKANFRGASLRRASFEGANLVKVDFREADLTGARFDHANLHDADFRKANLKRVVFQDADLSGANLFEADLGGILIHRAFLRRANLSGANLRGAYLIGTNIDNGNLERVDLREANLIRASLREANLREADLSKTNLSEADLSKADLRRTKLCSSLLIKTNLVEADLRHSDLTGSKVYGVSAWDVKINKTTTMKDLVISTEKQPLITLDDIEVAQFTYMIIDNKKLKRIIDNMRMKGVLILGSFDQESKTILTLLKDVIRKHGYIPFLFNFEPPQTQEHMETVKTMALLSSFIIVDLSRRSGQLHELASLVKDTFIPFATIARHGTKVTAMQREFRNYFWYKHDYYSYCHKTAPREIPKLFENEILPWANRINKEIRKERTRSPQ